MAEGTKLASSAEVMLSELLPNPEDLRRFQSLLQKVTTLPEGGRETSASFLSAEDTAWLTTFMARLQTYTESRLVVSFDFWLVVLPSLIKAAENGQQEAMRKRGKSIGPKKEKTTV